MDQAVTIRTADPCDATLWETMREAFWPASPGEHTREIARDFAGDRRISAEVLLAENAWGETVGFVELSIRSHAEGCHSGHVGYLEGWYVKAGARRRGVGAALVHAAQRWARAWMYRVCVRHRPNQHRQPQRASSTRA